MISNVIYYPKCNFYPILYFPWLNWRINLARITLILISILYESILKFLNNKRSFANVMKILFVPTMETEMLILKCLKYWILFWWNTVWIILHTFDIYRCIEMSLKTWKNYPLNVLNWILYNHICLWPKLRKILIILNLINKIEALDELINMILRSIQHLWLLLGTP